MNKEPDAFAVVLILCIIGTFLLQLILITVAGLVYRVMRTSAGGKTPEYYDAQFKGLQLGVDHAVESLGRIEGRLFAGPSVPEQLSTIEGKIDEIQETKHAAGLGPPTA